MRRLLPFVLVALAVPSCVYAQASEPVSKPAPAAPSGAAKPKPRSAFGSVIAELTRAAQEQAAAGHKAAPQAATTTPAAALPPPPRANATPVLADSSGG